jgi:hypothetical protein
VRALPTTSACIAEQTTKEQAAVLRALLFVLYHSRDAISLMQKDVIDRLSVFVFINSKDTANVQIVNQGTLEIRAPDQAALCSNQHTQNTRGVRPLPAKGIHTPRVFCVCWLLHSAA